MYVLIILNDLFLVSGNRSNDYKKAGIQSGELIGGKQIITLINYSTISIAINGLMNVEFI